MSLLFGEISKSLNILHASGVESAFESKEEGYYKNAIWVENFF